MVESWSYKKAGVDIKAQDEFLAKMKKEVEETHSQQVLGGIGGFGGLFQLKGYRDPVLVASTDGVGTKLLIAQKLKRHQTIGQDLVAMCVNDILVQGARPLFFLDYLASGKLDSEEAKEILRGIIEGCKLASCALLGGETAEMPDFYPQGRYDLAGFALGAVEREDLITGEKIEKGDLLIGLASSGLHSNGFSLVRRLLLDEEALSLETRLEELKSSLGEELLVPTRIYASLLIPLFTMRILKGMAHITGGGIPDNIRRILPESCQAVIHTNTWSLPPIFQLIKERGEIDEEEMFTTFNMGVGFVLCIAKEDENRVMDYLKSYHEKAFIIGEILSGRKGVLLK